MSKQIRHQPRRPPLPALSLHPLYPPLLVQRGRVVRDRRIRLQRALDRVRHQRARRPPCDVREWGAGVPHVDVDHWREREERCKPVCASLLPHTQRAPRGKQEKGRGLCFFARQRLATFTGCPSHSFASRRALSRLFRAPPPPAHTPRTLSPPAPATTRHNGCRRPRQTRPCLGSQVCAGPPHRRPRWRARHGARHGQAGECGQARGEAEWGGGAWRSRTARQRG